MSSTTRKFETTPQHGFSLPEVLVSLCVIAILAALLIPALKSAQGNANRTRCAANLRQIGFFALAYANENQGTIVPVASSDGSSQNWSEYLYAAGIINAGMIKPDSPSFLVCPSIPPYKYKMVNVANGQLANQIYGRVSDHAIPMGIPVNTKLQSPDLNASRQVLFADSGYIQGGKIEQRYQVTLVAAGSGVPRGCLAHNGGINVAFVDGHVEGIQDRTYLKSLGFSKVYLPDGTLVSLP